MTDEPTAEDIICGNADPDIGHYVHLEEAEKQAMAIVDAAEGDPVVRERVETAMHHLIIAAEWAGHYQE